MSRNFELIQMAERQGRLLMGSSLAADNERRALSPVRTIRVDFDALPTDASRPGFGSNVKPEIAHLVRRLFLASPTNPRSVAFSQVSADAAGTFIAADVCEALCTAVGGTVCLLDAKVDSPTLHEYFGLTNERGLTTALQENVPIASAGHRLEGFALTVIPAGPSRGRGEDTIVELNTLRGRLRQLSDDFDYVVIDAPRGNASFAAAAVGQGCEGVVMIVDADHTRRDAAQRLKDELEAANVVVLGAVLNNRRFPVPEYLYARL